MTRQRRSREETESRLIEAVGRVLARDGFRALGVNALAREADVDKVLIYRYFGDLDGLTAAYAREGDFWYRPEDILPTVEPVAADALGAFVADLFRFHLEALLARPQTLEILAWETVERNALTAVLEEIRETRALPTLERVRACLPEGHDVDFAAFATLMGAATNYLAIRSRTIRTFNGIDFRSDEGKDRLFAMIARLAQGLVETTDQGKRP